MKRLAAIKVVITAVQSEDKASQKCFFLDGSGGTGKTFLCSTLMNVLRGMSIVVLLLASTGIAAALLMAVEHIIHNSNYPFHYLRHLFPTPETTLKRLEFSDK